MKFRLFSDRSGNIGVLAALLVPILGIAVGSATDFGMAYTQQREMQEAVDQAALGAVRDNTHSDDEILAMAKKIYFAGAPKQWHVDADNFTTKISRDAAKGVTTLTLTVTGSVPTTFMRLAKINSIAVLAQSQVKAIDMADAAPCLLTLNGTASPALQVKGNAKVTATNCRVHVNSASSNAMEMVGVAKMTAKSISVVGNYTPGGTYSPTPATGQSSADDPLASLAEPSVPGSCTYNNKTFNTDITIPGGTVFCGKIDFKANITLGKGIHYFKGATVKLNANANLTGTEVMLYFDKDSALDKAAGSGAITLTAPTSGTYKGIAIFGTRTATTPQTFDFTGTSDTTITGVIYVPRGAVTMTGTPSLTIGGEKGSLICDTFSSKGTGDLVITRSGAEGPDLLYTQKKVLLTQ